MVLSPFNNGVDGFSNSGSKAFERDFRVRGETPASVRSPQAPARRANPCCKITTETTRPIKEYNPLGQIGPEEGRDLPPRGSRGNAGKYHVPKIAKNATRLEYASLR